MEKKVTSVRYGNIHYYAQCRDCKFDSGIGDNRDSAKVRSEVYAHCKKTGHTVSIESGSSTDYFVPHWGNDV
jgi:hypothetical protein